MIQFCAQQGKASPQLWDTYLNDWVQTDFPAVIPQGRSFAQYFATVGTEIVTECGGHLTMLASGLWYGDVGAITTAQWSAISAGAKASLATGVTATLDGSAVKWGGAAVGWVRADGVIACIVDPFGVVSAASASAVDYTLCVIPGGSFGDGDVLEVFFPSETAPANVGNDVFALVLGAVVVDSASSASATLTQARFGVTKNGTTTRKIIATASAGLRTNTFSSTSIDWSADVAVKLRITPATIGNTSYVRHASARIVKC